MSGIIRPTDNTVITAKTAAENFDFDLAPGQIANAFAYNLGASDYVNAQMDMGGTYRDIYEDGAQVRLSSTNNVTALVGPGKFRLAKQITTNNVSVHLDR